MYEKCVKCPKVGTSCEGPHFFTMSAAGLLEWCKARKTFLKLSNEKLAVLSGTPKGTIDRLFSGEHLDFKFETIRPLIKVLAGGEWIEAPCPDEPDKFSDEKISQLEEENTRLREKLNEVTETSNEKIKAYKEEVDIFKDQLKWIRISSAILGVLFSFCLVILIVILASSG